MFEIGKKDWMFSEDMLNCIYKHYNNDNEDESYKSDEKQSESEK